MHFRRRLRRVSYDYLGRQVGRLAGTGLNSDGNGLGCR